MQIGSIYDNIKKVIYTEKANKLLEENKYVFEVLVDCNKNDIKKSIEKVFDIEVVKVNIINSEGKTKKFKGREGKRKSCKKAIVTVKQGQSINYAKVS